MLSLLAVFASDAMSAMTICRRYCDATLLFVTRRFERRYAAAATAVD